MSLEQVPVQLVLEAAPTRVQDRPTSSDTKMPPLPATCFDMQRVRCWR